MIQSFFHGMEAEPGWTMSINRFKCCRQLDDHGELYVIMGNPCSPRSQARHQHRLSKALLSA